MLLIFFFSSNLLKKNKAQQFDNFEIFESKIKKMDNLKMISEFMDLLNFYHLKKCIFKDCNSCWVIDIITQIYILFFPNYKKKDGEALVFEFQKYIFKYFGTFYSLCLFGIHSHIAWTRTALRARKKINIFSMEWWIRFKWFFIIFFGVGQYFFSFSICWYFFTLK